MSKAMKQDETNLVPRLRFPEFRDAGEWVQVQLKQLGELVSGLTYTPDDIREEGLLVLRSSNIQDGAIVLQDNVYVRPDIGGANLSRPNDILICVRNGSKSLIGKNALMPEGLPPSTHGAFMTVFRSENAKFIHQLFQTTAYQNQVAADLGATINSINGNQLRKYEFYIPKLRAEQQRIADCLSSLDSLIAAQAKKTDALKTHKKGLMHRLFPREGETVPRLRFPEFRDAGEWDSRSLEDMVTPVVRRRKKPVHPYMGLGVRSHGKGTFLKHLENPEKNAMEYLYEVHADDLIVNITFAWEGAVAIAQRADTGGLVSHRFPTYTFKRNVAIPEFFRYIILDKLFVYGLGVISPGGAGRNRVLNRGDFLKIEVLLPELAEQQRIADCLSSLDALIAAQTEKLNALKAHKQGLMQQLFPAVEAVTA